LKLINDGGMGSEGFFCINVVGNGKLKAPLRGFSECEADDEDEFDSDGGDDERRARVMI
jgi:hypothetical protein